jgi:hypothetical protein
MSNVDYIAVTGTGAAVIVSGVLLFLSHRWQDRRLRRKFERLQREETAGIPPTPCDYRYAITFDDDDFFPPFALNATEVFLRETLPNA